MSLDSRAAEPHYMLAKAYYKLAIFDMVDRGLCTLSLKPRGEVSEYSLQHGYVREEVLTVLSYDCSAFRRLLEKHGLDRKEQLRLSFYVLNLSKETLAGSAGEMSDQMTKTLGTPDYVPTFSFRPDFLSLPIFSAGIA